MTTYISAVLAPSRANASITTKAALKAAIKADPNSVEFISTSALHRSGSHFTLGEAVTTHGPRVGIEVRMGRNVHMVMADARKAEVL